MVILGIDPGLCTLGWGLVQRGPACLTHGVVAPPTRWPLEKRLHHIYQELVKLIKLYKPHEMAIESPFLNQVRDMGVQNTFKLGHAYGVILCAGAQANVPIFSYTPANIKKNIAGHGQATKEQILFFVTQSLSLPQAPSSTHEADSLAVALLHMRMKDYDR